MDVNESPHTVHDLGRIAVAFLLGFLVFLLVFIILFLAFVYIIRSHRLDVLSIPILVPAIAGMFVNLRTVRHLSMTALTLLIEVILASTLLLSSIAIASGTVLLGTWATPKREFVSQIDNEQSQLRTFHTLNRFYTRHSADLFGDDVRYLNCYQIANNPTKVLASLNADYLSHSWSATFKTNDMLKELAAGRLVMNSYVKWANQGQAFALRSNIVMYKLPRAVSKHEPLIDGIRAECIDPAQSRGVKQGEYVLEENISHEYNWHF